MKHLLSLVVQGGENKELSVRNRSCLTFFRSHLRPLGFLLLVFSCDRVSLCNLYWPRTHCVARASLGLMVSLLPLLHKCWDHRYVLSTQLISVMSLFQERNQALCRAAM